MPTLNEGTLLYMPTTLPGISVTKAAELMQTQDRIIKSFPEVASVYGKAGRAATATDPAPIEMFETVVNLKPKEQWRPGVTIDSLIAEMDKALQFPGVSNAWTMPIKARIDMLSTGIRTPVGVKVMGTDLVEMDRLAKQIESVIKTVPGTSSRLRGARDRRVLSRDRARPRGTRPLRDPGPGRAGHHCGRARRPDGHDDRRGPATLYGKHALSARPPRRSQGHRQRRPGADAGGRCRPAWAKSPRSSRRGDLRPSEARTGSSRPTSTSTSAIGTSAATSPTLSAPSPTSIQFPSGYYVVWSGQFEYLQRAAARLKIVVPVTLTIIFLLLYLNFRAMTETLIVMLSLPFALVGGIWMMWWLGLQPVRSRRGRVHCARGRRRRDRRRNADLSRPCSSRDEG